VPRRATAPANALRWYILAGVVVVLLVVARIALHYAADLTITSEFFDLLGMGDAYRTRLWWGLGLAAAGFALSALLALPVLLIGRAARGDAAAAAGGARRQGRPTGPLTEEEIERLTRRLDVADLSQLRAPEPPAPEDEEEAVDRRPVRWAVRVAAAVAFVLIAGTLVNGLVAARDDILAARAAVPFGATDPVFGRDVSFYVFTEPAVREVVQALASALFLAGFAAVATGMVLWYAERQRGALLVSRSVLDRTLAAGFALGGLFLACLGVLLWLSRYTMLSGGTEVVAGAGAAARDIDLPTRAVGAVLLWVIAAGLIALAVPTVRRRLAITGVGTAAVAATALWAATAVVLVVVASPWWLVLAVPLVAGVVVLLRSRDQPWARRDLPPWAVPAFAAGSAVVVSALGPVGAALNDAIVLRGTQLQVERENIEATLVSTRRATGLDQARRVEADYRPRGVTAEAIRDVPASVNSLRFLDLLPTQQACQRLEARSQFYTCADVDVDRYALDGQRRTVFSIGREIDYTRAPDFQRRHFTYTHGYGIVLAPVNEVARDETGQPNGRPVWVAGGIPQRGISPELRQPRIYFGAQPGVPWAMVNTTQPVWDGLQNRPGAEVPWCTGDTAGECGGEGGTGIRVGSGWRRLALTEYLGGLPYIGGGRRVWNATAGGDAPAGPDSRLLLHRDITSRVRQLAPFLTPAADPWFVASQGRLWVVTNLYATSDRYPYAAAFGNVNYVRQPVMAAMDAYSGRTYLFVTDPDEPVIRTWRDVYPSLFTDAARMDDIAPGLRQHMRYGEDLFDFQSAAAARFHVQDVETFFNGSESWAPTTELSGPGVNGQQIVSPARYTYAVLPEERQERFLIMRSYKPQAQNRGIAFSGWLAASSDAADFGRLTVVDFADTEQTLESLDTFSANVGRDPALSEEITQRRDSVVRGNAIVVPVGEGLLYVQPLYLDSPGDSLPRLWQVVVGFGDGNVYAGGDLSAALEAALGDDFAEDASPAARQTLQQLVERAASEFEAYRVAFGEGRYAEAARRLQRFQQALAQARALARAQGSGTGGRTP
jgi:uncharacterized membrane protein (UPF0182 family)